MKNTLIIFTLLFISCGKENIRKNNLSHLLMNQEKTKTQSLINPQIIKVNKGTVTYTGIKSKTFELNEVLVNSDKYFVKKWTYLSKLEEEQDSLQFDFPINHIDRRMNLVRLQSLNKTNLFKSFNPENYNNVELKFSIEMNYQAAKEMKIRDIQFKLYSLSNNFKKIELAEAPLLKYSNENEDLHLQKGSFKPNYSYQLVFKITPKQMTKLMNGSSWTGLYVSNFEIATRNKIVEYKNQWQNDYRQQKIFILKDESLLEYSTDLEVNSFMKSIYPETEFHNDGTVMYFMGKRTYRESQRQWRKMKNNKQQFVGFFTSTDYKSFSNKEELVDKNQLSEGRVLVEIRGQKLQPAFIENSKILTSIVDQPRVCHRHTRWDKAECYEIDRSCHVRTRDEVSPKVFELNPNDFENTTLIKFNGHLGMEISNSEDIKPM
ncbi:MAG: hypothetical protein KC493_18165, partial [Bacteriovoracaceae bacterium]|nr:hypothetical protein [Bacteriovoracaceae bacterium]